MSNIIGIDLGTTNSEVAIIEDGRPKIISVDGEKLLPSVVGLDNNGNIIIGRGAKNQYILVPENTIKSIKREMGTDRKVKLGDKEYTPSEISAFILKRLRVAAEGYLKEPCEAAVISVPAYFTDAQRQATKEAGTIAGLDVVRILNEPTAASLVYGLNDNDNQRIAVYDLGGGTFDISIVEVNSGVTEVLASTGNNRLGGDDFDEKIKDEIILFFKEQHDIDLASDRRGLARVVRASEQAKILLSDQPYTQIKEEFITKKNGIPLNLIMELYRHRFNELIEEMLQSTIKSFEQALKDAGLKEKELDRIILVGGSTKIPFIREILEERFNKVPHSEINPDECVALGAAVQAGIISGETPQSILVDVNAHSLGIRCLAQKFSIINDNFYSTIIKRNTAIPVTKSEVYSTCCDNQKEVKIEVYQGEKLIASENTHLGEFIVDNITKSPAGGVQVIVEFSYDINGIVNITAREKGKDNKRHITVDTNRDRPDTDMDFKVKSEILSIESVNDDEYSSIKALINRGEKIISNVDKENSKRIKGLIKNLKKKMKQQAPKQTLTELEEELIDILYQVEV
ncbi:MAG: Hsp70 family protein [Nitrospinota bacterium]